MKMALLSSAIIASLGTSAFAGGTAPDAFEIQPVVIPDTTGGLAVGSLTQGQIVALAAALGITVAVLLSQLDGESDGT